MGAATRASTAKAVEELDAITRPDADLGDQLLAAARAIASSHQLVAILADPGVPAEQRSALVQRAVGGGFGTQAKRVLGSIVTGHLPAADDLGGGLGAQARRLLGSIVTGRWSDADDLVGGIEEIGIRALARARGAEGLESELFTVQRAVTSDGPLELALGGQSSPIDVRLALVDTLLKDANPATRTVVRHIVQLPRGHKPVDALARAQDVVADARDRLVAVVETARPLSADQADSLAGKLEARYGRKIALNQVVQPDLVAGVRITVGDDVIDGTVRARLDDLRLRLAG